MASLSSFCTAIEALLHQNFHQKETLYDLIEGLSHPSLQVLKPHLHLIRDARNTIHAQKAARTPTVTIGSAHQARGSVERLLMCVLAL